MSQIILAENASAPATPSTNYSIIYPKADGLWYGKDDAGTETQLSNAAGGGMTALRVYTASATWTKPAGLICVVVQVIGAGGGGGGCAATGGGQCSVAKGGGGGGGSIKRIVAASLGATETVTIGAAGAGGSAGNNAGSAGGTSSFGAHASATGGAGGGGDTAAAALYLTPGACALGGVGSSGDLNFTGTPGALGMSFSNSYASGGRGGDSCIGGGAFQSNDIAGANATNYGAGGAGASSTQNVAGGRAGGAGTVGIILVYEY